MDSKFKVIFLGESGTGAKTSLINRMVKNEFRETILSTYGVSYCSKCVRNYLGNEVQLTMWDTPGQEKFRSISKSFIKGSHCIILGYDITIKESFDEIKKYHYHMVKEILEDFPLFYLVANKIDLYEKEKVSEKEARSFAEETNMKFIKVSAKTGEGINILLEDIANSLTNKFLIGKIETKKKKNKFNIFHKFKKK